MEADGTISGEPNSPGRLTKEVATGIAKPSFALAVPPFVRADQLRSALLHFTVYLVGCCFLASLYFMLLMIRPYFSPLFWAAVLSVPLHSVKQSLIISIQSSWNPVRRNYTSVSSMAFSVLQIPLQLLLGPLWKYILVFSERFGTFIGNLSNPEYLDHTNGTPLSSPTGHSAPEREDGRDEPSGTCSTLDAALAADGTGDGESSLELFAKPAPKSVAKSSDHWTPNAKASSMPNLAVGSSIPLATPPSQIAKDYEQPVSSSTGGSVRNRSHRANTVGDDFYHAKTPQNLVSHSSRKKHYGDISMSTPAGSVAGGAAISAPSSTSRPLLGRRAVTYGSVYRPLSPVNFSYAQQAFSTAELSSVVDSVMGNLRTAPSGLYFAFLVRCSLIYALYLLLINTSQEWLMVLVSLLVFSIVAYVLYHFIKGIYIKKIHGGKLLSGSNSAHASPKHGTKETVMFPNPFLSENKLERGRACWIKSACNAVSSAMSKALLATYYVMYRRIDLVVNDKVRLNNFITVVLIIAATTSLLLFTVFISIKITQEANSLVDLVLEHIYENESMREQFKSMVGDLRSSALQYFDGRLAEFAPGSNLTAVLIFERLQEGYYQYFHEGNASFVPSSSFFSVPNIITNASFLRKIHVANAKEVDANFTVGNASKGALLPYAHNHSSSLVTATHVQNFTETYTKVIPESMRDLLYEIFVRGNVSAIFDAARVYSIVSTFSANFSSIFNRAYMLLSGRVSQWNGTSEFNVRKSAKPGDKRKRSGVPLDDAIQEGQNLNAQAKPGNATFKFSSTVPLTSFFTAQFAQSAAKLFSSSISLLSVVFLNLVQLVYYGLDLVFQCVLFFVTLYSLLKNEVSIIHYFSRILLLVDTKQKIRASIEGSIQNVLVVTVKLLVFHMLFVWLSFSIFQVEYTYTAMLMSAILGVLPLTSQIWVALPAVLSLWVKGQMFQSATLLLLHVFVSWVVDAQIYREIRGTNPFFSVLFIVLGFNQFGFEGLLWGPLIGTIPFIAYQLYGELTGYSLIN